MDGTTLYPNGPVKIIPLVGGERSLVYYIQEGSVGDEAPVYVENSGVKDGDLELTKVGTEGNWEVERGYEGAV